MAETLTGKSQDKKHKTKKPNLVSKLTSGGLVGGSRDGAAGAVIFCRALICSSARKGARHIGQLLAWYRKESAHELHRHRCLQGRINVSLTSHMQITHSEPPSSVSSSELGWERRMIKKYTTHDLDKTMRKTINKKYLIKKYIKNKNG